MPRAYDDGMARRKVTYFHPRWRTPPKLSFGAANKSGGKGAGWTSFWIATTSLCLAVFAAIVIWGGGPSGQAAVIPQQPDPFRANFHICDSGPRITCVVDGDTIWFQGRKIRIADINTPETSQPGCASEARLGKSATFRLQALLNDGSFNLESIDRDTDKYGRELRIITRDGQSLGDILVDEGLAEEWQGYRRDWC